MDGNRFSRGKEGISKRRLRGMELVWLFVFAFILAVPMLWIAVLRSELVHYGYEVHQLKIQEVELVKEREQLRAELARLKSPSRIFREMRRMNLVPIREQVVVITPGEALVADAEPQEDFP